MSNTNAAIKTFEKVLDLFFDSGDIIVAAPRPNSDTTCLFKLHRRVLWTQTKGLSDVLTLPESSPGGVDVNEYFEGTPVVRLLDDPADLAKFFKAIYFPSTLIFRRSMATNATDAFSLLVLADKYVADDIECMIEYQIRQDWPLSLCEWDACDSRAVYMYRMCQHRGGRWDTLVPEPASYIRLARIAKVAEHSRVAAAFYQLSRMNTANDWETERIVDEYDNPTPTQLAKMRRAMWSILSEDELRRVERGKRRLINHVAHFVRVLARELEFSAECLMGWMAVAKELVGSDDILADLLKLGNVDRTALRMCDRCLWTVRKGAIEGREEIWAKLPEYFEVCANERATLGTFSTADAEFILMD